jgi:hypothetical protein
VFKFQLEVAHGGAPQPCRRERTSLSVAGAWVRKAGDGWIMRRFGPSVHAMDGTADLALHYAQKSRQGGSRGDEG